MRHPHEAAPAGLTPPTNDEDQTAANGLASRGQIKGYEADSATNGAPEQGGQTKMVATLQARAALAGFELVRMADGSFVVARWTMTRALHDVAAVDAFLAQVGAR